MDIQKILLPRVGICTTNAMYFHSGDKNVFDLGDGFIKLNQNETVAFDTFFNSFSVGKWKKYTFLSNLFLELDICGDFTVTLLHKERINNAQHSNILQAKHFNTDGRAKISLEFPLDNQYGIYYFYIKANADNVIFYGGKYFTKMDKAELNDINLGLAICTYKKEAYIQKNIGLLNAEIIQNPDVSAYGHLDVFISDNGQTLSADEIANEAVHIFPNLNVGGTGGFTRALIEILNYSGNKSFSHVIFTDDDIVFEPDIFARTYALLACLKPEFQHCSVGGATMRLETKHIQHTRGDCWNGGLGAQNNVKAGYDLSKVDNLLKNEIEEPVQYNAWLFSCVPLETVRRIGLPLPIFIHRDDCEYGLRNGAPVIHLNGIGAWHSFGAVYSGANEYYDMRNAMITNAIHRPDVNEKRVIKFIKKRMKNALLRFRYNEVDLMLRGVEDFCRGVDWLKAQDPVQLHKEIVQISYTPLPAEELIRPVNFAAFWSSFNFKESKKSHLKRMLTLNGWLGSSKKNTTVSLIYSRPINFYRVKQAIQYNQSNNTGIITEKNYSELFRVLKEYCRIKKLLYKKMRSAIADYNARYTELTGESFWRPYLQLDNGTVAEVKKNSKNSLTDYKGHWLQKHMPGIWNKLYQLKHPHPFSYRAAFGVHLCIAGCNLLKRMRLENLSKRMRLLQQAHNRHLGERCFIIGNGPSLRISDLELLKNEMTFASNSIYLAFDKTNWRPDYYVFIDFGGYKKLAQISNIPCGEFAKKEAFLSSKIKPDILTGKERFCHIDYGNHTKTRMLTRKMKRNDDISVAIYDMFTVTNASIEIAMYMGFKEIYLLGVDCDYSKDKMHFIETDLDYSVRQNSLKSRMMDYGVSYMRDAYTQMEIAAKAKGVKIYNATRGGALEAFERIDFDNIVFK